MKKRLPQITYDPDTQKWTRMTPPRWRSETITHDEARAHWEAVNADWSMGAYNEMMRRVMA